MNIEFFLDTQTMIFILIFFSCLVRNVQLLTSEYGDVREGPLFLTPLLEENKTAEAQALARIFTPISNTTSYTGYFTVDQECESHLFFWFCQAQENWEKSPVILWLQGGPGFSSLYGLFMEIGPFYYENGIAKERVISWNVKNNLLFIDQPVGTGFSYTGKGCFAKNKTDIAKDLYSAIIQFYRLFPLLKENSFYIAGESYAGHYIPYTAQYIHKKNSYVSETIKLTGLMIGNGWLDSYYQRDSMDLLYYLGLIDNKQKEILKKDVLEFQSFFATGEWENAMESMNKLYSKTASFLENISTYNFLKNRENHQLKDEFVNFTSLRNVLHVGSQKFAEQSSLVYYNLVSGDPYDTIQSVRSELEELLEHYPIVLYFGQLDTMCPYSVTLSFLRDLRWSGAAAYQQAPRRRWCAHGQLAGFYRSAHNLHEVLVRNAGHSVPLEQPLWAFTLADSVTSSPPDDPLQGLSSC